MDINMTSEVEKWLNEHPDTSSDYVGLVRRIKSGEIVECVITINRKSHVANADYIKTRWGELFNIVIGAQALNISFKDGFIDFCEQINLLYAKQDFLKSTRKTLEIAKNAAEFKAVSVPLNTLADVEVLLAIMDKVEVSNGSL